MYAMHVFSTGVAATALGVVLLGAHHIERRAGSHARLLALIVCVALLVGNTVSLLPGAPTWYSLTTTALTVASALWATTWVPRPAPSTTTRVDYRVVSKPYYVPAPTTASTAPLYAVPDPGPIDADVVTDAPTTPPAVTDAPHTTSPVASILRNRPRDVVTADDLHDLGPTGSRATMGGGAYVAAGIEHYTQRASRSEFTARRHDLTVTDDDSARRLRVLRAYGATGPLQGRLRDERG